MLRRLNLASQFILILSIIFIIAIFIGGLSLSKALESKAQTEMTYRAQLAMQLVNAVKSYTSNDIAPLLASVANPEARFFPETVPSLSGRRVFERFKQDWQYKDLMYKDATLNPTNLHDKADLFEANLILEFEQNRDTTSLSGFRSIKGEQLFYSAQPLIVKSQTCLKCHSSPSAAPKSHIKLYGDKNGYGWKLNQIIGTQIIYVPASEVFDNAHKALLIFISIFIIIFALVIVSINYLIKWRVIQPLKPMAQLASYISQDAVNANEVRTLERSTLSKIAKRSDEFGYLGRVFQKMVREVEAREHQYKVQLQQLQVEIDHTKRQREVAEIEESDYFKNLQKTAKEIRNQWDK
ncbi:sensor protein [Calothrix sp. NIES-4071]|nr:sensor protein [Calothrix sp. NIES-4071]BAZ55397.1 sensor protein [Calothrix sp. NIES-4105]